MKTGGQEPPWVAGRSLAGRDRNGLSGGRVKNIDRNHRHAVWPAGISPGATGSRVDKDMRTEVFRGSLVYKNRRPENARLPTILGGQGKSLSGGSNDHNSNNDNSSSSHLGP